MKNSPFKEGINLCQAYEYHMFLIKGLGSDNRKSF